MCQKSKVKSVSQKAQTFQLNIEKKVNVSQKSQKSQKEDCFR